MSLHTALVAALLCLATTVQAEVVDPGLSGFLSRHDATINTTPANAYKVLVGEIGSWWNPSHSYTNDGANLSLDPRPGGCFCEKLPNGGGVQHLGVVYAAPGQSLRMTGALGPLQNSGVAGSMTWRFTPVPAGTKVDLTYSVGGYMQGGFEKMAPGVDFVVGEQLSRFKTYIETGKPVTPK